MRWAGRQRIGGAAVTAVSIKLCHVIWRIMTDKREYLAKRPVPLARASTC